MSLFARNRLFSAVIGVALVLAGSFALHAGAANVGRVTRIYPQTDGTVYFWLDNGCKSGAIDGYWTFSLNSDTGKAWYAMLLSAANNKSPVAVAYSGVCTAGQHQPIWYVYQDF